MKRVTFTFNSEVIHEVLASDLDTDTVVKFKSALAASRGIDSAEIEVDWVVGREDVSDSFVRNDGSLMYHPKHKTYPVYAQMPVPAMDITKEELFEEFLLLISKGNVGDAIIFM
jgi:hypothetical protein